MDADVKERALRRIPEYLRMKEFTDDVYADMYVLCTANPVSCLMSLEPALFARLAEAAMEDVPRAIVLARLAHDAIFKPAYVLVPVVNTCMAVAWRRTDMEVVRATARMVHKLCRDDCWVDVLLPHLLALVGSALFDAFADAFQRVFNSTSVAFTLMLAKHKRLDSLAIITFGLYPQVFHAMVRQWPERIWRAVAHAPASLPPEGRRGAECPITLCECVRPVVASDGHVYERDAIMTHMVSNGPTSPLTRELLTPHLYVAR